MYKKVFMVLLKLVKMKNKNCCRISIASACFCVILKFAAQGFARVRISQFHIVLACFSCILPEQGLHLRYTESCPRGRRCDTRNRNRFVERSTRKSLDLCRFSRVRKRKNLWVLPISSPHFPKRIGWRYNLEGCPSGRRCDSRKVVCRKAPRVRIPNPPPTWEAGFAGFSFLFPVSYP